MSSTKINKFISIVNDIKNKNNFKNYEVVRYVYKKYGFCIIEKKSIMLNNNVVSTLFTKKIKSLMKSDDIKQTIFLDTFARMYYDEDVVFIKLSALDDLKTSKDLFVQKTKEADKSKKIVLAGLDLQDIEIDWKGDIEIISCFHLAKVKTNETIIVQGTSVLDDAQIHANICVMSGTFSTQKKISIVADNIVIDKSMNIHFNCLTTSNIIFSKNNENCSLNLI